MKVIGIIPVRFKSKRFPGKPLADISGKPMVQHVYERAKKSKILDDLIIATDDKRIFDKVKEFKAKVVLTGEHPTGTDRCAEVARKIKAEIVVNIQGDEPVIDPEIIDNAVEPLIKDKKILVSTLVHKIEDENELENPNIVKVVVDKDNFALYFSRSVIPYYLACRQTGKNIKKIFYKHIGLYVYRKDFLLKFVNMPQSMLEKAEELEQLRALENGYRIKTVLTNYSSIPVDVPKDIKKVEKFLKSC